MGILRKNIIANYLGNGWQVLMSVLFVPLYIRFMGVEAYGLIGVFTTLQAMLGLLDMGLSGTLNREMARLSALPGKRVEMRNLVRTLEMIYWGIALTTGFVVALLSPLLAHHWVNAGQLPPRAIEQAVLIMGFVVSLQMTVGFYSGGLMGLQKQVLLNSVNICLSTLRGGGAVLLLWLVSPTIQAFFLWQIAVSVVQTVLLALLLWRGMPLHGKRAVFRKQVLAGVWKFTAGVSAITILGAILSQSDKIILSKMLSLEVFGYYTLASVVAMSLGRLSGPLFIGMYPRFTQLVSLGSEMELKQLYHRSCQFMSILILPVAIVVAMFSHEIILIWTGDALMADKSHLLITILVSGTALNGLMCLPYALQLASGWTDLSLLKNIVSVILLVPLMIYMTTRFGATGAAAVWLAINLGDVLLVVPAMHRRLLREEKWRWYWQDVGLPLGVGLLAAGLGRALLSGPMAPMPMLFSLTSILIVTLAFSALVLPATRGWLTGRGRRLIRAGGGGEISREGQF